MDGLFFAASKTLGMIVRGETWLMLGLLCTLYGVWRNKRTLALRAGTITTLAVLVLTLWPLGDLALEPLEGRYPANPALDRVDAIIVLGGAERTGAFRKWGGAQVNEYGERLMTGVELSQRFPQARLIFTGGEAALGGVDDTSGPSELTKLAWLNLGVDPARIVLEGKSRNTAENARFTYDLVQPKPDEHFLLVTSAFHMPRSMQSFATAGWQNVTAWPVDFRSGDLADGAKWRLDDHLDGLNIAMKEYLGLFVYKMTDR